MCIVSNIGDNWRNNWIQPENPYKEIPKIFESNADRKAIEELQKSNKKLADEMRALKKEMESLKKLLKAAKVYDEETGQKDCEMDDKVALIKKIADLVGVDMKEVFDK